MDVVRNFFSHLINVWSYCGIGYDVDTVLEGAGTSRTQIEQEEPPLQMRHYFRALQLAAPLAVDSGFFLKLGQAYNLFDLGILGYALYSAPTLRHSWDISLGESNGLVPHPIGTGRQITDEYAGIVLRSPAVSPKIQRALCEEWLFGTWRWMCQRLPVLSGCTQTVLHLDYASPAYRYLYREAFPGKINFNMSETALWIPRQYYEQPFESANIPLMRLCHQRSLIQTTRLEYGYDLASEVRLHLLQNGQMPFPSIEKTAGAFQIPVHTLHRRLARQKTTFRRIKLEVKMTLARQYLKETNLSLQVISHLLGYGQTTSFVRAFRNWYDMPPARFRSLS